MNDEKKVAKINEILLEAMRNKDDAIVMIVGGKKFVQVPEDAGPGFQLMKAIVNRADWEIPALVRDLIGDETDLPPEIEELPDAPTAAPIQTDINYRGLSAQIGNAARQGKENEIFGLIGELIGWQCNQPECNGNHDASCFLAYVGQTIFALSAEAREFFSKADTAKSMGIPAKHVPLPDLAKYPDWVEPLTDFLMGSMKDAQS